MANHEILVLGEESRELGGVRPAETRGVNPALAYLSTLHSEVSRKTMGSKLNVFAQWVGYPDLVHCVWAKMRPEHVLAFMAHLDKEGRKGSTINCYLAALKGVAKAAWVASQMDHETYLRLNAIKQRRYFRLPAGRAITHQESARLLADCNTETIQGCRDRLIFALMLGCGLRRAEVTGIRLADLRPLEKAIRIIGKGDKERIVFLAPEAWSVLETWLTRYRGESPGFLLGRLYKNHRLNVHQPLDPSTIGRLTREHMTQANHVSASAHDLRRTFATRLLDNNVDISTVKRMMGHANIATTAMYDRRGDERMRQVAETVSL